MTRKLSFKDKQSHIVTYPSPSVARLYGVPISSGAAGIAYSVRYMSSTVPEAGPKATSGIKLVSNKPQAKDQNDKNIASNSNTLDDLDDSESSTSAPEFDPSSVTADTLQLSPSCVEQLKKLKQSKDIGALRITVDTGGCSGFQYIYSLMKTSEVSSLPGLSENLAHESDRSESQQTLVKEEEDFVFLKDGTIVVVDEISMPFLVGAVVEYKVELIRAGFAVRDNPNVDLACGCGTSFAKKS